jgi:ribonuclease HI
VFAKGQHIFCDGACEPNPGAGGWGVVAYNDGNELDAIHGGNPVATNNQMELTGLLEAIEWAKAKLFGEVTIWCDSQYCVDGVNEWLAGWKRNGWNRKKPNSPNRAEGEIKNLELWQAIDEVLSDASKSGDISVKWVKGHAGIAGNERADELAEIGRQEALERGTSGADLALAPLADASRLVPTPADDCRDLDERYRQIMGAA